MLLLRCSLLADSMSRSTSFCPSTIATRNSSAWVALNSMRFMSSFPAPISAGPGRCSGGRPRPSGALNLTGGGRGGEGPRRQHRLPGYEGPDAGGGHLWRAAATGTVQAPARAGLESVVDVLRVVAQTGWRLPRGALRTALARAASQAAPVGAVGSRIRCALGRFCAPRVIPLHPGDWPVRRLRSS